MLIIHYLKYFSYLPGTVMFFFTMNTDVETFSGPKGLTWAHWPRRQEKARQLPMPAHQRLRSPSRSPTAFGACCCIYNGGPSTRSNNSTTSQERQKSYPTDQIITSADKADGIHIILDRLATEGVSCIWQWNLGNFMTYLFRHDGKILNTLIIHHIKSQETHSQCS